MLTNKAIFKHFQINQVHIVKIAFFYICKKPDNMKSIFTSLFLILISFSLFAQSQEIVTKKKALGTVFMQNDRVMSTTDLFNVLKQNPETALDIKRAKSNLYPGMVVSYLGGFLIGWPIGTAIGGGEPQWGMALAGAGFIALGIPLSIGYTKHVKNAVNKYNDGLGIKKPAEVSFKVGVTNDGVGLKVCF